MKINDNCNLVLSSLYEYDFAACGYNILKSIGWNLSKIDFNNKEKRNIQIGLLQRDNPSMARFILESTVKLVNHYLKINNIQSSELIVQTRDGFILSRPLKIIDSSMPIDFRSVISKMIISANRKSYLLINTDGKVIVKGIKNRPINSYFYDLFKQLDFSNKTELLLGIERIRRVLFKC